MRKLAAGAISAVLIAATSVTAVVPAQAAPRYSRDYYVSNFCRDHPGAPDCRDWRDHGHRWSNDRYRQFYRDNHSALPAIVGGIFGFALGAAAANASRGSARSNWSYHVRACEAHYRSYDPRTDTFMGYDGLRHRCTY